MIDCSNLQKEDAHIKRYMENALIFLMHNTILSFIRFNDYGTHHLNELAPGIYFLLCSVYLSPSMYTSPDKYGT